MEGLYEYYRKRAMELIELIHREGITEMSDARIQQFGIHSRRMLYLIETYRTLVEESITGTDMDKLYRERKLSGL